jgi:hypothetical protein
VHRRGRIGGPYAATGDALIAAVSPKLNGPTGCNAGFLRDDALLVVAIIDNTYDEQSLSSAKTQYDKVIAAKKDPNAVVMLAITAFPPKEGEPLDPNCIYDDGDANNYLPAARDVPLPPAGRRLRGQLRAVLRRGGEHDRRGVRKLRPAVTSRARHPAYPWIRVIRACVSPLTVR